MTLELKNITTVVNPGTSEEKKILKDLSLTIEAGDFITLLGTNGAGKSTLLNVINGSLKPATGTVPLRRTRSDPTLRSQTCFLYRASLSRS